MASAGSGSTTGASTRPITAKSGSFERGRSMKCSARAAPVPSGFSACSPSAGKDSVPLPGQCRAARRRSAAPAFRNVTAPAACRDGLLRPVEGPSSAAAVTTSHSETSCPSAPRRSVRTSDAETDTGPDAEPDTGSATSAATSPSRGPDAGGKPRDAPLRS